MNLSSQHLWPFFSLKPLQSVYKNSLIAMKDILCLKKVYTISIHSSRLQTMIAWRVKKVQDIDIRTTLKSTLARLEQ